ncbi:MAG: PIN domain-containing protein [Leptospirales bacterium]
MFSSASLWEIVINRSRGRPDFQVDPHVLRIDGLPMIHKDPFDRILVAQAIVEGMALIP